MPNKKKTKEKPPKSSRISLTVIISLSALFLSWLGFEGNRPTLYESNATVTGELLTVKISDKGRTAHIGKAWCAAGAFLNPGTAKISKLMDTTPEFFRPDTIVSDQQEPLEMYVPTFVGPANSSPNWVVACKLPYWDDLDKWKLLERDLEFCYEVQPTGAGQRSAVMCPAEERSMAIHELRRPK
jgi:hypothetical protein